MKTNLTIKNFRVFDENGVSIELNPITILTGCNSSGKSSVVKAVFLLYSFLSQIKKDIENKNPIRLDEYKLDFSSYPNNLLGRFDRVIHSDSSTKKVMMEYTVYSLMLSKDVTVQLVFSADSNDELNNAHLESISMRTDDGVFFSSSKNTIEHEIFRKGNMHNYNIIMEDCLDFLQIDFLVHYYCGIAGAYDIDGSISKEEYEKNTHRVMEELKRKRFKRNRLKDVVNHIYYSNYGFGDIIRKQKANYNIVEWSKNHGSLFMIPVLDRLDGVLKDDVWSIVEKEFLRGEPDDSEYIASKKIVDDFVSSDAKTFSEYFRTYERMFLERQEELLVNGTIPELAFPNLSGGLYISQDYLLEGSSSFVEFEEVNFDAETGEQYTKDERAALNKEAADAWKNQNVSFDMIYEVVMLWNKRAEKNTSENEKYYTRNVAYSGFAEYSHTTVKLLGAFVSELLQELVTPDWCGNMEYVSSSRASVKRLYPLDANDDFTQLLKKYYEGIRASANAYSRAHKNYETNSFMNKWIKKFEIGDSVSIHVDKEGLGVQIRLHKNHEDEGRLLADEGYGITQLVSILIQIETAILNAKMPRKNKWIGIDEFRAFIDGYEDEKPREVTIAIEEPEIHLHPAYQSMLADMIVEAYKAFNIHFIIETHSEYLVRKLQVLVAAKGNEEDLQISNDEISIIYVNSPKVVEEKGVPQVKKIGVQEDGRLDSPFGTGFFDEADNQAMELLRIKATGKG